MSFTTYTVLLRKFSLRQLYLVTKIFGDTHIKSDNILTFYFLVNGTLKCDHMKRLITLTLTVFIIHLILITQDNFEYIYFTFRNGLLRGMSLKTSNRQKTVSAFLGIPFATPPGKKTSRSGGRGCVS